MEDERILGNFVDDVRDYLPGKKIIVIEKDGVPQDYEDSYPSSVKVKTQNNIITEIIRWND